MSTQKSTTDAVGLEGSRPQGLLLTLDRGIRVLEDVAASHGGATAKSLSSSVGINLGTCYQLLRTLQANGYVHRLPGGRYGLGSRVEFLADHYEVEGEPPAEFINVLHELHQALQETVYVSLRRGRKIEVVGVLEGTKALRVGNLTVGYGDHPHARASVKAFLASADRGVVEEFFQGRTMEALTPNTITNWDQLIAEMDVTRSRGYAIDNEEFVLGVSCIGAVIVDGAGKPFGAYGTSFPSTRLEVDGESISELVMSAGEKASRAMGYEGPYPPKTTTP